VGFITMALLAVARLPSKPKWHRQAGVILSAPTLSPGSLGLGWKTGHRPSESGLPLALRG
jgi:hypothetical protein